MGAQWKTVPPFYFVKIIAGLGNPGKKYDHTRHNLGFAVLDWLCDYFKVSLSDSKFKAETASVETQTFSAAQEKIILAKPQTFMNLSGESVGPLARFYQVDPSDVLVLHDELAYELGKIRFSKTGSSAGHNGIQSIIDHLGTKEFLRLRLGIGAPSGQNQVDYVLGKFKPDEKTLANEVVEAAGKAVLAYLTKGLDKAMHEVHAQKLGV